MKGFGPKALAHPRGTERVQIHLPPAESRCLVQTRPLPVENGTGQHDPVLGGTSSRERMSDQTERPHLAKPIAAENTFPLTDLAPLPKRRRRPADLARITKIEMLVVRTLYSVHQLSISGNRLAIAREPGVRRLGCGKTGEQRVQQSLRRQRVETQAGIAGSEPAFRDARLQHQLCAAVKAPSIGMNLLSARTARISRVAVTDSTRRALYRAIAAAGRSASVKKASTRRSSGKGAV
jgi:hypothetical protein